MAICHAAPLHVTKIWRHFDISLIPCEYSNSVALTFVLTGCWVNWVTTINPVRQVGTGAGAAAPLTHFLSVNTKPVGARHYRGTRQHSLRTCVISDMIQFHCSRMNEMETTVKIERKHAGLMLLSQQECRQSSPDVAVSHCSSAVVLSHGSCSRL